MYKIEKAIRARHCIRCERRIESGEKVLINQEYNQYGHALKFNYCIPNCAVSQINKEVKVLSIIEKRLFGNQGA